MTQACDVLTHDSPIPSAMNCEHVSSEMPRTRSASNTWSINDSNGVSGFTLPVHHLSPLTNYFVPKNILSVLSARWVFSNLKAENPCTQHNLSSWLGKHGTNKNHGKEVWHSGRHKSSSQTRTLPSTSTWHCCIYYLPPPLAWSHCTVLPYMRSSPRQSTCQ